MKTKTKGRRNSCNGTGVTFVVAQGALPGKHGSEVEGYTYRNSQLLLGRYAEIAGKKTTMDAKTSNN